VGGSVCGFNRDFLRGYHAALDKWQVRDCAGYDEAVIGCSWLTLSGMLCAIIIIVIIIIITDLYSAFRSKDTETPDAAQEDEVSLNRWVFKWRLKVRMFSHSRM